MLNLLKVFSASNEIIMWVFSFNLFIWWITLTDFYMLSHPCISGMKSKFVYMVDYIHRFSYVEPSLNFCDEVNLIIVDDSSDVFLDLVSSNLLGIFASMFMSEIHL